MARYIDADHVIRELSEISGRLTVSNVGEAIGRVPTADVVNINVYKAVLEELCLVRDQLETQKRLVRDLITELGRRYEHN